MSLSQGYVRRRILFLLVASCLCAPKWVGAQADSECLDCHADKDLRSEQGQSLHVDPAKFKGSIHGRAGVSCADCHQDLSGITDYPHSTPLKPAQCSTCHQDIESVYLASPHGKLLQLGDKNGPTCNRLSIRIRP